MVAGNGRPDPKILVVFVLGTIVMRSAGCIINDFVDRNVDPHVRRTRERPLAARRIGVSEAFFLFALLCAIALWLVTRPECPDAAARLHVGLRPASPSPLSVLQTVLRAAAAVLGACVQLQGVPMSFAALLGVLPRVTWTMFLASVSLGCRVRHALCHGRPRG